MSLAYRSLGHQLQGRWVSAPLDVDVIHTVYEPGVFAYLALADGKPDAHWRAHLLFKRQDEITQARREVR
jgi:hypothetical protein